MNLHVYKFSPAQCKLGEQVSVVKQRQRGEALDFNSGSFGYGTQLPVHSWLKGSPLPLNGCEGSYITHFVVFYCPASLSSSVNPQSPSLILSLYDSGGAGSTCRLQRQVKKTQA